MNPGPESLSDRPDELNASSGAAAGGAGGGAGDVSPSAAGERPSLSEPIRASFTWTPEEHQEAVSLVYKQGRIHRTRSMISYVVAVLFAYVGIMSFREGDVGLGVAWILAAVIWVAIRPMLRMRMATMMRSDPGRDKRIDFEIDEVGVKQTVESLGEIEEAWPRIGEAIVTERGTLLFRGARSFFWLPRKAFASPDDYETFLQLLHSHVKRIRRV